MSSNLEWLKVSDEVPHNDVEVLVRSSGKPEPVEYAVAYMDCHGRWQPVGVSSDGDDWLYLDIEPYEWAHIQN